MWAMGSRCKAECHKRIQASGSQSQQPCWASPEHVSVPAIGRMKLLLCVSPKASYGCIRVTQRSSFCYPRSVEWDDVQGRDVSRRSLAM